ncbi:23S rRNA (uracil(1939)-C(5))-methyltransferase RlmD [Acinetobacter qingfengensis]|uniref:23S rRNA (uracil(1939)-C(5))-methyltransferase RlmD n=1 Tax=Acinetobacter qingfengensis TaxID=1262585 RepID=A0A1E7QXD5_9GAMM|nr:23S rRNA (uracil(1939)-C(5))-methyltransferase RlmD [Acinetobacter qingfengensis]KAA8731629.1 23S rRNA (uracil(1939)-C(5))-methyltransferase RlmD [Acinetobacter qingfengensis]OEY91732.1 23S rRNA (uracil(1939)-C(5))-methyltransferase [Acinetobacter qingfengensis]
MKRQTRSQPKRQQQSQSSQSVTFTIQNLSHEGRGVALYGDQATHDPKQQGKKAFVRFALPGELVQTKITKTHKRFDEAELIQVIDHVSSHRVAPTCQHFGVCGGCSLQHLDAEQQIIFKQQVVASHLQHFAGVSPEEWLPPIRNAQADYRRKARMGVRWREKQQQMVLGFREQNSNYLVPIQQCSVLDQRVSAHLLALTQTLASLENKTAITHIEFALGDRDVALLIRHVTSLQRQDIEKLLDFVKKHQWQLYLLPDRYQTLQRIDAENATMRLHYALPEFALNLAFSPLDFTQVNANVNRQMVYMACQLLDLQRGERVLDLFCGLGNFSLALAQCVGKTGQVIAVEGVEEMVRRGEENAKRNQLQQVSFYAQDLSQDFSNQTWAKQGFDALLIDPPRSGAEQVMHYAANFAAKRIVYVSCNPATLARDAAILIQQGYRLVKAGIMDMFSHTEHVESIALFEKIATITSDKER